MLNFFKTRYFASLALVVAISLSCKPASSSSRVLEDGVSNSNGGCPSTISAAEEAALFKIISQASTDLLQGKLSASQHEQRLTTALGSFQNKPTEGHANVVVSGAHAVVASAFVLPIAITLASDPGFEPPTSFFERLINLGVPPGLTWPYMQDVTNIVKDSVKVLASKKINYDLATGWNFSGANLNVNDLNKDGKLKAAFLQLFSPGVLTKLLDIERSEAIRTENLVFLPADKNGAIATMSEKAWTSTVEQDLKILERETKDFIRYAKESATYWNLMSGRLAVIFGGERGHKGKTAPEIGAEGAYKAMLLYLNRLNYTHGVGGKLRPAVIDMIKVANLIEAQELQAGIKKLDAARNAAIAAPFVPIAIWAAPYAGGLIGPAFAASAGSTSASMALTPLIFAAANATVHAAIDSSQVGGTFSCALYEQFVDKSSRALVQAPFMAALPAGSMLLSSGVTVASKGAVLAETAYGVFNVSLASYSVFTGAQSGVKGLQECQALLKSAEEAGKAGQMSLVNARAAEAYKACTQAGLDLGQSIVQAGNLTKSAYDVLKNRPLPAPDTDLSKPAKYTSAELEGKIGKYQDLSQDEIDALVAYGGPNYKNINDALRSGKMPDGVNATHVKNLDIAMSKTKPIPDDVVVFRGRPSGKNIAAIGDIVDLPSYTSTSIDPKVAMNFSADGGVIFEMRAPKGKSLPGIFMPLIDGIPFKSEAELLLPRGTKFKVISSEPVEVSLYENAPPVKFIKQVWELAF